MAEVVTGRHPLDHATDLLTGRPAGIKDVLAVARDRPAPSAGAWPRRPRDGALEALGAVRGAAAVGHGARGLQRRRRRLGLLPPRPRALARLPLERGRPGRRSATSGSTSASALALWNGSDPILKERLFGLTNSEGNHGEDVKEY